MAAGPRLGVDGLEEEGMHSAGSGSLAPGQLHPGVPTATASGNWKILISIE